MYRGLLLVTLLFSAGALAIDAPMSGRVSVKDDRKSIDVSFSSGEAAAIRDYYRPYFYDDAGDHGKHKHDKHGKRIPPGLAKKGGLPPGLAKRQRLPRDVDYELLPTELEAQLPPLPSSNYVRVKVGQDFAILDKRTRVVLDVALGLTE